MHTHYEFETEAFDWSAEYEDEEELSRFRRFPTRSTRPRAIAPRSGSRSRSQPIPPRRPGFPRPIVRRRTYLYAPESPAASEYVRWVQTMLNQALNLQLPIDGVLSVQTRSAVRSFQKKNGLPVTGIVGPDTERALQAPGAPGSTAPAEPPLPAAEPELFDLELIEPEWAGKINRSSPEYVRWVQRSLNAILGLRLPEDGISGTQTRSATRSFQQRKGLTADGRVESETEGELIAESGELPPSGNADENELPADGLAPVPGIERTSPQFRQRVIEMAEHLGMPPNYLMAVMSFESNLDPAARNKDSGATGLIQFMPSTAARLGTSTDALRSMTAEQQLEYVARYFEPYRGRLITLEDAYMAVLWPTAIGRGPDFVLFSSPSIQYQQNSTLDINKDGRITVAEATSFVRRRLGSAAPPSGGSTQPAGAGSLNRTSRDYIKWVQRSLNQILGLQLAVDGISGTQTRSAIRSFQQQGGLTVDGIVGPQTEGALIRAGAGNPPGAAPAPYIPGGWPAPPAGRKELSGAIWVSRFSTSRSTSDLEPTFANNVNRFISALKAAGASVSIAATYRPQERAYLMHWAWKIANGAVSAQNVPPMSGVEINWWHGNDADSRRAAQEMVNAYDIVSQPSLTSRHTERRAIDMSISWSGNLQIKKANGQSVPISSSPKDGTNRSLIEVGRSYGVIHLEPPEKDRVHWSVDGK